jgi:hypothetical protein
MTTFTTDLPPTRRDYSPFTIGVVAVLIATLLALPFLAHPNTARKTPPHETSRVRR